MPPKPLGDLRAPPTQGASTKDTRDDLLAMGFAKDKVKEMMAKPEPKVDSTGLPMGTSKDRHEERLRRFEAAVAKRERAAARPGVNGRRMRGGDDVHIDGLENWILFDPLKGYPPTLPWYGTDPPAIIKKYARFHPGNKKIVAYNRASHAIALRKTPESFQGCAVQYLKGGPKLVKNSDKTAGSQAEQPTHGGGNQAEVEVMLEGNLPSQSDKQGPTQAPTNKKRTAGQRVKVIRKDTANNSANDSADAPTISAPATTNSEAHGQIVGKKRKIEGQSTAPSTSPVAVKRRMQPARSQRLRMNDGATETVAPFLGDEINENEKPLKRKRKADDNVFPAQDPAQKKIKIGNVTITVAQTTVSKTREEPSRKKRKAAEDDISDGASAQGPEPGRATKKIRLFQNKAPSIVASDSSFENKEGALTTEPAGMIQPTQKDSEIVSGAPMPHSSIDQAGKKKPNAPGYTLLANTNDSQSAETAADENREAGDDEPRVSGNYSQLKDQKPPIEDREPFRETSRSSSNNVQSVKEAAGEERETGGNAPSETDEKRTIDREQLSQNHKTVHDASGVNSNDSQSAKEAEGHSSTAIVNNQKLDSELPRKAKYDARPEDKEQQTTEKKPLLRKTRAGSQPVEKTRFPPKRESRRK